MRTKRHNESYYQYRANCCIRKENGTEEIKSYELETDIMYGSLHFWNNSRYLIENQNFLFDLVARDSGIVKCKILKEKLVLIPRFTYKPTQKPPKKKMFIRRILFVVEMIILLLMTMSKSSDAVEKEVGFYADNPNGIKVYESVDSTTMITVDDN